MSGKILTSILAGIFVLAGLSVLAAAAPAINSVELVPSSSIWVGESLQAKVNCTDSLGVSGVVAQTSGSNGFTIPNQTLSLQSSLYQANISVLYLTSPNNFTLGVVCTNTAGEQTVQNTSFTLSNLTVDITSMTPSSVFLGDQIELGALVKRNGQNITSGVVFTVKVDGSTVTPLVTPPFDPTKGWVIYLPAISSSGSHEIKVVAQYDRASDSESKSVSIGDSVSFSITNIGNAVLSENSTVMVDVRAFDKGSKISVTPSNLAITIGSAPASIHSITPASDYYTVTVFAPDLSPGSYSILATLTYNGSTYTDVESVSYAIVASGKITDIAGNGVVTDIKFFHAGVEKYKLSTKTDGEYEGNVLSGTYTIEVDLPEADMRVFGADVDEFDDPIKYYHLTTTAVEGFRVAGLHVFEVGVPFSEVELRMSYDESKVDDEGRMRVWKCSNWSNLNRRCNTAWHEESAEIDTIANSVLVETESLSAFAIGTLSNLSITHRFDDQDYPVSSPVKFSGVVVDSASNTVPGASITISIFGTAFSKEIKSDSAGLFSTEFQSPDSEGNYTIEVRVKKNPFVEIKRFLPLNVVRYRVFSLAFPDTVKIRQGEEVTHSLKLANNGQSDLFGLKVEVEGLDDYYVLPTIEKLGTGEERSVPLVIRIPADAETGSKSVRIKVSNSEVSREKVFGLIVSGAASADSDESGPDVLTGLFLGLGGATVKAPQLFSSVVYVAIFAAAAFTASFLLRKKRRHHGSEDVKRNLMDVKTHVMNERSRARARREDDKKGEDQTSQEKDIQEKEKRDSGQQTQRLRSEKTYSSFVGMSDRFEGLSDLEKVIESAREQEEDEAEHGGDGIDKDY